MVHSPKRALQNVSDEKELLFSHVPRRTGHRPHVDSPLFSSFSDDSQTTSIDIYFQRALLFHCFLALTNGCFELSVLSRTNMHGAEKMRVVYFLSKIVQLFLTFCQLKNIDISTSIDQADTHLLGKSFDFLIAQLNVLFVEILRLLSCSSIELHLLAHFFLSLDRSILLLLQYALRHGLVTIEKCSLFTYFHVILFPFQFLVSILQLTELVLVGGK